MGQPLKDTLKLAPFVGPTEETPYVVFASGTRDFAMLTLMSDPGIDRYRISVRLRQLPAVGGVGDVGEAAVGLFWGYRESAISDGTKARAFMTLRFSDVQPNPAKVRKPRLALLDIGQVEEPLNPNPRISKQMGPSAPLDFVGQLPGPWRDLTVDVAPDELTLHLPNGPHTLGEAELADNCTRLGQMMRGSAEGKLLNTANWSPRAPIGVYVDRSRVAVERFVIGPFPLR